MLKGTIKWYDKNKGYGFIEAEDGYDLFLHKSSIKNKGANLFNGDKVTFEVGTSKKGPEAKNVMLQGKSKRKTPVNGENIHHETAIG